MPFVSPDEALLVEAPDEAVEAVQGPPGALDTAASAWRQWSSVTSLYERVMNEHTLSLPSVSGVRRPTLDLTPVEDYNPLDDIAGFEEHALRFVRAESPNEVQLIKDRIRQETHDKAVIDRAGGWGVVASLAAGVTDPLLVASMAVPAAPAVGALGRAGRVATGVAAQAAIDTTAEALLHSQQELRTAGESAFNIGAGAILSGVLGTIATRVPKAELEATRKALHAQIYEAVRPAEGMDAAGASRVVETTLEDEGIAKGGRWLARTLGQISPETRLLQSPLKTARILTQKLVDVPYLLQKNLKGIATHKSVEGMVKRLVNTGRRMSMKMLDTAFVEYKQAGGTLGRRQFSEEVSAALTRGDASSIPQVASVVSWARKVFEEDKAFLKSVGIEMGDEVLGAKSYFPRVYNFEKIIANRNAFEEMLYQWYKNNPLIPKAGAVDEARVAAELQDGVSRAETNLRIAERDAIDAAKELDTAVAEIKQARQAAKDTAQEAGRAERAARTTRKHTNRLASKLRVLLRRMSEFQLDGPKATPAELEQQIADTTAALKAKRAEVKTVQAARAKALDEVASARTRAKNLKAQIDRTSARKTAVLEKGGPRAEKQAVRLDQQIEKLQARLDDAKLQASAAADNAAAARSHIKDLRAEADSIRETITGLKTDLRIVNAGSGIDAFKMLDDRVARVKDKLNKSRMSVFDADSLAKELKDVARQAVKAAGENAKKLKEVSAKATEANRIAREAVPKALEDAEIKAEVLKTVDRILGMPTAKADLNLRSRPAMLKERVLDVPDELLAPYLERDFDTVMSGYFRGIAPEIEMRRHGFSSPELNTEIDEITEESHRLIAATSDNVKKEEISDAAKKAIEDITLLRDRLLGNVLNRGGKYAKLVRAARIARTYNYVRLLGSQMLSSMSDAGKLVARYGLVRTVDRTARFLTNWNLNKLTREEAKRIGTALELTFDMRASTLGDIAEELPRTRLDKGMQWASSQFSKISLMSPWNATLKGLSTLLEQDEMARALSRMNKHDVARLAASGIDQADVPALREMFARHSENVGGVIRARTELWEDQRLARIVEDSIAKVADEIVVTKGIGDLPAFMDNEFLKTVLQFRSFAMASVNRTMIPVAQGLAMGDARTAQGIASMLALGMLTYYAKEFAAGREPDTSPERLVAEAFNWSGMLGYFPDLWDPVAAFSPENDEGENILPRFSRFKSRSPTESLFGPTFGTGLDTLGGTLKGFLDMELEQRDVERARRLMPAQNLFWARRVFNAIEGEVGEALDAEGSTTQDFWDRVEETQPTK